jgi:uncharacterized protein involved in propanediol utilization
MLMPSLTVGHGAAIGHHGEIFQGQIEDSRGWRRRCLVSLPCNRFWSKAKFYPCEGALIQIPAGKQKAEHALRLTIEELRLRNVGGRLALDSNIPERKGYGSSTADCVATVLAAAHCAGRSLSEEVVARLVVEAEGASDTIMFQRAVLFAQREGTVLEDYLNALPGLEVLGMDCDEDAFVDTLSCPAPAYSNRDIETFHDLAGSLRLAIRAGDLATLGTVATASAAINQRFFPKPMFSEVCRLTNSFGALGVAAAHSGTVLSILLDPHDPLLEQKVEQLRAELAAMRIFRTMRFATHWHGDAEGREWHDNSSRLSSTLTDPI